MAVKKYKLNELAKDLKLQSGDLIECLAALGGDAKKTVSSLTPEEVSYVFEYFTQKHQVENFDAYFAANVAPEKPAEKKPKKEPAKKPEEPKAEAPKAEEPKPEAAAKAPEKPEVQAKAPEAAEARKPEKRKEQKKQAKKQDRGERTFIGGSKSSSDEGYTVSEGVESGNRKNVDTRGSYVELDKYNEKYDNLANTKQNRSKDNFQKKQKLTQKSQQYKKQQKQSAKRREGESEKERLRRLELEKARKQQLKVLIPDEIVISELATRLKVTVTEVIKKLMGLGVMASINETIDFDTAFLIGSPRPSVTPGTVNFARRPSTSTSKWIGAKIGSCSF